MQLFFSLHYHTKPGETLHAVFHRHHARPEERRVHVQLDSSDNAHWHGTLALHVKLPLKIDYYYEVRRGEKVLRREWNVLPRSLDLSAETETYFLMDAWRDLPEKSWRYTSCITDVFMPCELAGEPLPVYPREVMFSVQTPAAANTADVGICGECPALGRWNTENAPLLVQVQPNTWRVAVNAAQLRAGSEYKFFLRDKKTGCVTWEEGLNRTLLRVPEKPSQSHIYHDLRPQFPPQKPFRAAGVVIPVFSLRSEKSGGAGDFGDLKLLTDWAVKTGQKVIQLLPVYDTTLTHTWRDSYPYNAISVYAFHPIYADVRQLPKYAAIQKLQEKYRALNTLKNVDYENALKFKLACLKTAFDEEGEHVLGTPAFHEFFHANAYWLPAYAMFCVLRDEYGTADFHAWPQYSVFSDEELHRFCAAGTPHESKLHFWYYVQFVLHTQLLNAVNYAREHGVIFKGDIPIGISPHSVEAWTEPQLFHLNAQAGAPPDDFSATGQNWGFPTYNWPEMARDNYRWWRCRLTHLARYFDAYRLDHVLGFFRIWQIPTSCVDGLLGQFSPALPLTKEEIKNYGLTFREEFLHPYITLALLKKHFGTQAEKVAQQFLTRTENGRFTLRPAFDTQRKIEQVFSLNTDEESIRLKHGLQALCTEVLFVADQSDSTRYHPRIAALHSDVFAALSAPEQRAFTHLYTDFFFHRHNAFWEKSALAKLPVLTQCTRMLCCAEDLGMVPACVPDVMHDLQMLSLEVQRMPKKLGEHFADIFHYPYLSVATPSTHDMSVLRAWWKEDRKRTQQFWHEVLKQSGLAPEEMSAQLCGEILNLHLKSNSMLTLIGLQDWLGMDEKLRAPDPQEERINVPANPHHYWCYRMHLTLEELLRADSFNEKIKVMIRSSAR